MGKKTKNSNKKMKKSNSNLESSSTQNNLPYVSICTPTFNRRPFFKGIIQCIAEQDYDRSKMEWIVVDDGTDSVRDILESEDTKLQLAGIKVLYYYEKEKMDFVYSNDKDMLKE